MTILKLVFAFAALSMNAQAPTADKMPVQLISVTGKFCDAVAKGDAKAVAKISRFPIKSNEFGAIRNEKQLKKMFNTIFTTERKNGLVDQHPVIELNGVYSITSKDPSDPIQFLFKKFGSEYKFYSIDNVNE